MELSEQQKEELFLEFAVRIAEMEKADKQLGVAKNNHCLAGMGRYYHEQFDYTNPRAAHRQDARQYFFVYNCYKKLRAAVPAIVMAKKYKDEWNGPNYYAINKTQQGSANPVLMEEDIPEATKVGKILLDAMWKYLTEE